MTTGYLNVSVPLEIVVSCTNQIVDNAGTIVPTYKWAVLLFGREIAYGNGFELTRDTAASCRRAAIKAARAWAARERQWSANTSTEI